MTGTSSDTRAHAKLSCSGSHRWMKCPGSVKLSEQFPESSSVFVDEGTLAHDLGEWLIKFGNLPKAKLKNVDEFYASHPELGYTTKEMVADVKRYAEYALSELSKEKEADPDATIMTEQQVDLTRWIPGGFGTSDVVITRRGKLHIIDLKFGKGVKVSAKDNPQLGLYALGALAELDDEYHIEDVQMTIFQPRMDNVSDDFVLAADLYSWGANIVKPAADLTQEDNAPITPGEWCRFCPAKSVCRARAERYIGLEEYMKKNTLTAGEIAAILHRADGLAKWVEDLKEGAIKRIQDGDTLPGWKVVEGTGRRRFTIKDSDIIERCVAAGFDRDKVCTVKAKGITDLEKLMKDQFAEVLGDIVEKPAGKPTLAPDDEWK